MLYCINKIVDNVKNRYYGSNPLSPTGPGLLGSFFSLKEINDMKIQFTDAILENDKEEFMVYENRIILKYYKHYRDEQVQYNKNSYNTLWHDNNIYL